ncbi:hypothetical protein BAE44_0000901 [Dichanthelium oligosanthes]|uniref:Uncharacterized protein n=1 Tax=Dichanthelium oligosanthes TaxID=888268 RepID=A0A1E5WLR0_9POAL|nr:hypothetical protein BAE44_0000901 [Dichanthelium oligosanthes]
MGPCAALLREEEGARRTDSGTIGEGGWLVRGFKWTSRFGLGHRHSSNNGKHEALL